MIIRLLAALIWITASFSAHAEGARAHVIADSNSSGCTTSQIADTGGHCESVCLSSSDALSTANAVKNLPVPVERAVTPTMASLSDALPRDPPVEFRIAQVVEGPPTPLRDLSTVRLLI